MVHVAPSTPYRTHFASFLAKKHRLAADSWVADDTHVRDVYAPLVELIRREVRPEHQALYPAPVWKLSDRVGRLARNILLSEFLVREWAEHFVGKSEAEIDAIAKSFAFSNCLHRDGLNKILTDNATLVAGK